MRDIDRVQSLMLTLESIGYELETRLEWGLTTDYVSVVATKGPAEITVQMHRPGFDPVWRVGRYEYCGQGRTLLHLDDLAQAVASEWEIETERNGVPQL